MVQTDMQKHYWPTFTFGRQLLLLIFKALSLKLNLFFCGEVFIHSVPFYNIPLDANVDALFLLTQSWPTLTFSVT